ncbi:MAG: NAD(P)H-hydrate dehydratase [Parachlamydiaceae bacterium]|nr:NAD(P)H-hydrate dehydratase [Parachlamydiaceae bacterium]
MKVITSQQMHHLEAQAYRDGSSEFDFMEEAGSGIALVAHDYIESHYMDHTILLMCGKGNNAGDAYVAGIHLLHLEYDVIAYQFVPIDDCTSLCQSNYKRFIDEGGRVLSIDSPEEFVLPAKGLILDGLLGTGFSGKITDPFETIIQKINNSGLPIIAIDIPSGLNGSDGKAQEDNKSIIATETAFLGLPKIGFFLLDGWNSVGKLRYVDFGLPKQYINESETEMIMLTKDDVSSFLPKIVRNRHKYEAGYVIGLAGSPGMPGAALLASDAALHGGAGIVRLLHPQGMEAELASSQHELIKVPFAHSDAQKVIDLMNEASAVFIGPGIGRTPETFALIKKVLPALQIPCVIDADALFFLASNEGRNIKLPEQTILTPHHGEMNRLLGIEGPAPALTMDYLKRCKDFTANRRVTLLLKGGPSFIIHHDEPFYVSPHGDPGMATAGSGDILTGLVAALLAQKLTPLKAAILGCFIHGVSGEYAALELTSYCMTASDIMYRFPEGFLLDET